MRITSFLRVIIKDSSGSSSWRETSQLCLPKGGKKLSFKQNALIMVGVGICVFSYGQIQADFNPDSWWAKTYKQISADPFGFIIKPSNDESSQDDKKI